MSQYNKTKGSQFETDVMKWLRKAGVIAERLTKAGAKDEGDIVTVIAGETYILELKNRQTLSLPEFWREAQVEALNYAKARGLGEVPLSYVIVKRRNASIDQAWVISDLAQWLKPYKRDANWNLSYWDNNFDGTWNTVGLHPNGDIFPASYVSRADYDKK